MIDGERIEYVSNADYHLGAPQIDRFVLRIVAQPAMLAGLMNGDIDLLAGGQMGALTLADFNVAKDEAHLNAEAVNAFTYHYISIDNANPLMTRDVRVAIDRAVNKQRIVDEILGGNGRVAFSPWIEGHPYSNPNIQVDNFDPDEARRLLDEAGWDESEELMLSVPAGNIFREQVAVLVQQDLAAVGMNVRIQQFDSAAQFEAILSGESTLGIVGSAVPLEPNFAVNLFNRHGAWCFGRFTDDTYLEFFNRGMESHDPAVRRPIYFEFQELIAYEMPYVYLVVPDILFAYNNRLSNVNAFNFTNYMPIWEWRVS
jgi:peptide/nickel transport system substrate-binding protein